MTKFPDFSENTLFGTVDIAHCFRFISFELHKQNFYDFDTS